MSQSFTRTSEVEQNPGPSLLHPIVTPEPSAQILLGKKLTSSQKGTRSRLQDGFISSLLFLAPPPRFSASPSGAAHLERRLPPSVSQPRFKAQESSLEMCDITASPGQSRDGRDITEATPPFPLPPPLLHPSLCGQMMSSFQLPLGRSMERRASLRSRQEPS